MANNILGNFQTGYVDLVTGRYVSYRTVTATADGNPLSPASADGVFYHAFADGTYGENVQAGGQRRWVNVAELGLLADNSTDNSLMLAHAMARLPKYTTFYFPAGYYYFGPLPAAYNIYDKPVAINTGSTGANLLGEDRATTVLRFAPRCVGVQVSGGLAPVATKLSHLTLTGPGANAGGEGLVLTGAATRADGSANPDAGRTVGSASLDNANYQFNGLNAWGQVSVDSVDVNNFSGHNVCIFGSAEVHVSGIAFDVPGTLSAVNPSNNSAIFTPDDPAQQHQIGNAWKVVLGGQTLSNAGYINQGVALVVPAGSAATFPAAGHYVASVIPGGGALIADNSTFRGLCNFDFAGGSGMFITSDDSNQATIFGCSFRENGLWGLDDGSFLGTFCYGTHFSRNGRRVNQFGVDNIFGNNSLIVGAFITRYDTARSAYYGCYAEGGNQGVSRLAGNAAAVDGILDSGVSGGFRREGNKVNGITMGVLDLADGQLRLTHRGAQNTAVAGLMGGYTPAGGTQQVLFTPTNPAQVALGYVGQGFYAYNFNLTITGILPNQGWLLGPPQDYLPPRAPTVTPTTGYLIAPVSAARRRQYYTEINGQFGFGLANDGGAMQSLLTFGEEGIQTNVFQLGAAETRPAASLAAYLASKPAGYSFVPNTAVQLPRGPGPLAYRCQQGGTLGTLITGLSVTQNGPTLRASAAVPGLSAGQYYSIGGLTYEVTAVVDAQNFYVLPAPSNGSTALALAYAAPDFLPEGRGRGALAQRPASLGLADAGWSWFAPDAGSLTIWSGTAWLSASTAGATSATY